MPKCEVPEYLVADWDENGNARYALVGIKTLNKPDNDLILDAFKNRKEGKFIVPPYPGLWYWEKDGKIRQPTTRDV